MYGHDAFYGPLVTLADADELVPSASAVPASSVRA